MEKKEYTIMVYTENHIGILNRLTIIFTRRGINIESLNVSESEVHGISRFTIVVNVTEDLAIKVTKQIEKIVEVIRASYYDDVIHQEVAMYKIRSNSFTNGDHVEDLIRKHNARILRIGADYIILEKTGHKADTQNLFDELSPYGVLQFVRSGRIALTKGTKELSVFLQELDQSNKEANERLDS